ncbi:MAG TPA: YihY/virulence factor BrkB family protein [Xanthobacteraceae bacterium]|nr:YihY/virulence factor BrkB family protein [Xanthobacteraceae bacterium]
MPSYGARRQGVDEPSGEGGRGRSAETPSQIPPRGWKDVLLRVYQKIGDDRVMLLAAGITFYSLLAIFPAIAALVAIYGFFADPASIATHLDSVSDILPGGAIDVIRDQMNRVAAQGKGTLGATFIVGLVVSLWSANAAVKSMFDALNLVYGEREKRGFVWLNLVSLAFTCAGILFVLLASGATIVLPVLLGYLGSAGEIALLIEVLRWPVLLAIIGIALALLYRYGPSRERARWRWISWGSAFAAAGWLAASLLFAWYTANFGTYNKTYGTLGAVIGFMVWIWISAVVILVGAELDAEMEHQTARDTTTGAPKRLGSRGARVADTVGAPQD